MTIELKGMTEIKISTSEKSLFKTELRQLIKQVFELQEQRVHVWNEFDLKFKEYTLDAPNFRLKRLQLICKEISDQLNSISMQIIDIREKFSSEVFNVKKLYNLVADLQASEQIKFQLVTWVILTYSGFVYLLYSDFLPLYTNIEATEVNWSHKISLFFANTPFPHKIIFNCIEDLNCNCG